MRVRYVFEKNIACVQPACKISMPLKWRCNVFVVFGVLVGVGVCVWYNKENCNTEED